MTSEYISQIQLAQGIHDIISELKKEDYKTQLRRESTCLYCFESDELIMPEDFSIDQSFSFQESGSPDADRMLYAIAFSKGRKGYFIEACNVYSDNISYEMMEKLK